jgi:hypothetical protein
LLREGYGPEDFFQESGRAIDFDEGVAMLTALALVGHDKCE